jgi:hypothetical protein
VNRWIPRKATTRYDYPGWLCIGCDSPTIYGSADNKVKYSNQIGAATSGRYSVGLTTGRAA